MSLRAASGSGGSFAPLPDNTTSRVRYVDGLVGDDSHDGLTPGSAKLTLGSAYSALPSTGGLIYATPGRYDVDTFTMLRQKPASIIGVVPPERYIASTTTVPLSATALHGAILYSSSGAASLLTTIGGTASAKLNGLAFKDLIFELSAAATKVAIDINTASFGQVIGCVFYSDKTTVPAAVDSVGVKVRTVTAGTYGGDDASWWRIRDNTCINMALCELGNSSGTKLSANQHTVKDNAGLGLTHTNTSTLPFIAIYGGHRCVVRDNNIEAYNIGVKMDSCWDCTEEADGGEFVDVFVDLYNTKGCYVAPIGIAYAALGSNAATTPILAGAQLIRADSSTKANVFVAQATWTAGNTQRLANPTDDPTHPYLSLASTDNIVIAPRNSMNQGNRDLVGTGSPNSAVVGNVGDTFRRTDGGAGTVFYLKETGAATNTGWVAYGAPGASIPSQTGNAGKYLTTDGTTASWSTPPGSPVTVTARTADAAAITANTVLASDDTLLAPLAGVSSQIWFAEYVLLVNAANATMDMKIGFAFPTACTIFWGILSSGSTSFAAFGAQTTATSPAALAIQTATISVGTPAANTFPVMLGAWIFDGGTAGNVAIQFAQNTSDAGALTIKKGSFVRLSRLV